MMNFRKIAPGEAMAAAYLIIIGHFPDPLAARRHQPAPCLQATCLRRCGRVPANLRPPTGHGTTSPSAAESARGRPSYPKPPVDGRSTDGRRHFAQPHLHRYATQVCANNRISMVRCCGCEGCVPARAAIILSLSPCRHGGSATRRALQ